MSARPRKPAPIEALSARCPARPSRPRSVRIGRRAGHAIAVAEPVQQVAVAAALAAERLVRGVGGLAAERAGVRGGFRHARPIWRGRARPARRPRRRCGARARRASRLADAGDHRRRGVERRAARSAAPAWRSSARAAAPAGSAWRISGMRRPLAAADDLQEAEAVDRGALERLRQDRVDRRRRGLPPVARQGRQVDADRAADAEAPDRARRRRGARLGQRRRAAGRRRRRTGSWPGSGSSAARRRRRRSRRSPPPRAARTSPPPRTGPGRVAGSGVRPADPLGEARARRAAAASVGRSLGGLGRPGSGIASRTTSAWKSPPSVTPAGSGSTTASLPSSSRRDARRCWPGGADDHRAGAKSRQLDRRLDDLAVLDQDRAILADPFLVEPLSQADSRPRGAGRGSRTEAGRPRRNSEPETIRTRASARPWIA